MGTFQLMSLRFLVIAMLIPACASATDYSVRVINVSDGDTITVLTSDQRQMKIRLAGIDAPEKEQAFGQRSKASLAASILGRDVLLKCTKLDKYQRHVCKVMLGERDANLDQIETGMAWWYRKYAKEQSEQDRAAYESAEAQAKATKIGLWADKKQIPPWDWRKGKR